LGGREVGDVVDQVARVVESVEERGEIRRWVGWKRGEEGGDALTQGRAAVDDLIEVVVPQVEAEGDGRPRALCDGAADEPVVRRLAADGDDGVRCRRVDVGGVGRGENEGTDLQVGRLLQFAQMSDDLLVESVGDIDEADLADVWVDIRAGEEARRECRGAQDDVAADQSLRERGAILFGEEGKGDFPVAGENGDMRARR